MMLTIMTTGKHEGREKKRRRWKSCLLYWSLRHQQTIIWSVHQCSEYNTCVCLSCTCEQKFNQRHQEDTSSGARHARDNRHVSHTHRTWRKHDSLIWQWRHKIYYMCQWWVSCRHMRKTREKREKHEIIEIAVQRLERWTCSVCHKKWVPIWSRLCVK